MLFVPTVGPDGGDAVLATQYCKEGNNTILR